MKKPPLEIREIASLSMRLYKENFSKFFIISCFTFSGYVLRELLLRQRDLKDALSMNPYISIILLIIGSIIALWGYIALIFTSQCSISQDFQSLREILFKPRKFFLSVLAFILISFFLFGTVNALFLSFFGKTLPFWISTVITVASSTALWLIINMSIIDIVLQNNRPMDALSSVMNMSKGYFSRIFSVAMLLFLSSIPLWGIYTLAIPFYVKNLIWIGFAIIGLPFVVLLYFQIYFRLREFQGEASYPIGKTKKNVKSILIITTVIVTIAVVGFAGLLIYSWTVGNKSLNDYYHSLAQYPKYKELYQNSLKSNDKLDIKKFQELLAIQQREEYKSNLEYQVIVKESMNPDGNVDWRKFNRLRTKKIIDETLAERKNKTVLDEGLSHYESGRKYYNEERYEDAVREYNIALSILPTSGTFYLSRSQAYEKMQQTQKAQEDFKIAVQMIDEENEKAKSKNTGNYNEEQSVSIRPPPINLLKVMEDAAKLIPEQMRIETMTLNMEKTLLSIKGYINPGPDTRYFVIINSYISELKKLYNTLDFQMRSMSKSQVNGEERIVFEIEVEIPEYLD